MSSRLAHRPSLGATPRHASADWLHRGQLAPFVAVSADISGKRHKRGQDRFRDGGLANAFCVLYNAASIRGIHCARIGCMWHVGS